jgi:hypothetical protein
LRARVVHRIARTLLSIERPGRSVGAASQLVRRARCLTQTLAEQALPAQRHGHLALLHLGATRRGVGKFEAHAWLEAEGRVNPGGLVRERYTPSGHSARLRRGP